MLSTSSRRDLRAKSHTLKPVVLLGQHGLTPAVVAAIDEALTTHELIKVRLRGVEREDRNSFALQMAAPLGAEVVNLIGHIVTLYRAAPPQVIEAPVVRKPNQGRQKKKSPSVSARAAPRAPRERENPHRTSRRTSSRPSPRGPRG